MDEQKQLKTLEHFLAGKTSHTRELFHHFVITFQDIGLVSVHPAKTMIGIANSKRRIAYVTQLGRNFIHAVFPFKKPYDDNLCFTKIAQVPGDAVQFNHHFRMFAKEDLNEEVKGFMRRAYWIESEP